METFPSQTELIVAEALLLLLCSQTPQPKFLPQISSTFSFVDLSIRNRKEVSSSPTDSKSKSCSSTVTSGDSRKQVVLAVVARPREVKLKGGTKEDSPPSESKCSSTITSEVSSAGTGRAGRIRSSATESSSSPMLIKIVRKSRSQTQQNPNPSENISGPWSNQEMSVKENETDDVWLSNEEESTDESSLSDASSAEDVGEATSRKMPRARKRNSNSANSKRQKTGPNYLLSRGELILQFLAGGCASEARIRQVISDTPDTSKALRMLLNMNKIKRIGEGGRKDPFIYMVAEVGSDVASD
ncbi:hypothetical protein ACHQM5_014381 [Ranunculus cassubicifolius]